MHSWRKVKLDSLIRNASIELGRGNIISREDIQRNPGKYPIYSSSAQGDGRFGEYGKFMFDEELITWSVDGGGRLFYRPKHKYSVTNVCGYIRIRSKDFDCRFLHYLLEFQHRFITFDYTTKAHPSVIRHVYYILPLPVSEQRKIARILTTLDNLIEMTESLIAKYQAIKRGMMHDLFTRGLDAHGHLRPLHSEAPDLYKQSELGWIPKEWNVRRLEQLYANPIRDFGSFSSTNLITFLESGVPFIKSEMIEEGNVNWAGVTYISDHVHRLLDKSHVQKGNILFSKIGSALGKGVVYDGSHGVCNSNAAVAKIDIDCLVAGRHFVTYFLNHDIAKVQLKNMIVSLLPRINLGDLNRLLVPTPKIGEQHDIEKRLHSSDETITTEKAKLRNIIQVKIGLMQDMLTGRVRVKVDDAEEVAARV